MFHTTKKFDKLNTCRTNISVKITLVSKISRYENAAGVSEQFI